MYYVVSKSWIRIMTVLVIISIAGIFLLSWSLYDSKTEIRAALEFNEKMRQRNAATDEMLLNRAIIQQWVYLQICERVKANGGVCLNNPSWWADPRKYPALSQDSSGSGLFPSAAFDEINK